MSTNSHNLAENQREILQPERAAKLNVAIITADWNSHITYAMRQGATDDLLRAGVPEANIRHIPVPGTVELVNAAAVCLNSGKYDGIIIIGTVIRGDTPHFDYVCQIAAQGTAMLNARGEAPVIFCVLTVDNEQQALDRAGGLLGNKGTEASQTLLRLLPALF